MDDQDIIRKAIELADGFDAEDCFEEFCWTGEDVYAKEDRHYLDAVAAQLVRQVDVLEKCHITYSTTGEWVRVSDTTSGPEMKVRVTAKGRGRTMNTIKAIVQSKVLE